MTRVIPTALEGNVVVMGAEVAAGHAKMDGLAMLLGTAPAILIALEKNVGAMNVEGAVGHAEALNTAQMGSVFLMFVSQTAMENSAGMMGAEILMDVDRIL